MLFPPPTGARRVPVILVQSADRIARNMFLSQCIVACHPLDQLTIHEGNATGKSGEETNRIHSIHVDFDALEAIHAADTLKDDVSFAFYDAACRCIPYNHHFKYSDFDAILEHLQEKKTDRVLLIIRNLESPIRKLGVPPCTANDRSVKECIARLEDVLLSLLSTLVKKNLVHAFVFDSSLSIFSKRFASMLSRLGDVVHIQPTDDMLNVTVAEIKALLCITSSIVPDVQMADCLPDVLLSFTGNPRVSATDAVTNHATTLRTDVSTWFCRAVSDDPKLLCEEKHIRSTLVDLTTKSLSERVKFEDYMLNTLVMRLSNETWREIRVAVRLSEEDSQRVPVSDGNQCISLILALYDLPAGSQITDRMILDIFVDFGLLAPGASALQLSVPNEFSHIKLTSLISNVTPQALSRVAMRLCKRPRVRGRSIDIDWLTQALRVYLCDHCTLKTAAGWSQNGHVMIQTLLGQIAWIKGTRCDVPLNVGMVTSGKTLHCPVVAPSLTSNMTGEPIVQIFNVIDIRLVGLRWGTVQISDTWPSEGMKEFRQRVAGQARNELFYRSHDIPRIRLDMYVERRRSDTHHFVSAVIEKQVDREVLVPTPGGCVLEVHNVVVTGSTDLSIEVVDANEESAKKAHKNRGKRGTGKMGVKKTMKHGFRLKEAAWTLQVSHQA